MLPSCQLFTHCPPTIQRIEGGQGNRCRLSVCLSVIPLPGTPAAACWRSAHWQCYDLLTYFWSQAQMLYLLQQNSLLHYDVMSKGPIIIAFVSWHVQRSSFGQSHHTNLFSENECIPWYGIILLIVFIVPRHVQRTHDYSICPPTCPKDLFLASHMKAISFQSINMVFSTFTFIVPWHIQRTHDYNMCHLLIIDKQR